jgi:hypothetical protein
MTDIDGRSWINAQLDEKQGRQSLAANIGRRL